MDTLTLFAVALGLSMDTFAVMISQGLTVSRLHAGHIVRMAAFFGFFQALMPVVGWAAGLWVRDIFMEVARWVAFGLISFIGLKMIVESFHLDNREADPARIGALLLLSLATSLDALATGVSFALLGVSIVKPILIIGLVTFVVSMAGGYIGRRFGHFFERKIEIAGGIILIGIGIRILLEDLIP